MSRNLTPLRAFLVYAALAGCTPVPTPTSPTAGAATITAATLVDELRRDGFKVEFVETVQQPFFAPAANVYGVNGDDLQIYEFTDAEAAAAAAARVSPSGAIGGSMPMWIAPPHFYRSGRLIALYLGSNAQVMNALAKRLGPRFAGQ